MTLLLALGMGGGVGVCVHIVGREEGLVCHSLLTKQSLVYIIKGMCDVTQEIISDVPNIFQKRLPSYLADPASLLPWNSSQTPVSKGHIHPSGKKPIESGFHLFQMSK